MTEREPEPISIPGVLTDKHVEIVRAHLKTFHVGKTPRDVSVALEYSPLYVQSVAEGKVRPSPHFASRLAHALGLELEDLIFGEGS